MVAGKEIKLQNLSVGFPMHGQVFYAVDDVSLTLAPGRFTAIVGESGCGKSVLGQALLHILPQQVLQRGQALYDGQIIDRIRREFGVIPQNPSASLNPTRKIGRQLQDILQAAGITDAEDAYKKQLLAQFGQDDAARVLAAYPHELSGGMLQRVLCAMALSTRPAWILADEPTKGLDESVGRIVLQNLQRIRSLQTTSMLIITHDIVLARELCDDVVVMYAGQVLEKSSRLFTQPLHPYSQAFLQALPQNGLQVLPGRAPAAGEALTGCKFAPRCQCCSTRCYRERPKLYTAAEDVQVRCFLYADS